MPPTFDLEQKAYATGARWVAGVDEVGRGPLAGPVTAAAVILDPAVIPDGLDDSKKIGAARRRNLARQLRACAEVGVGHATVEEIDAVNILQASLLAMQRAVENLRSRADRVLIDGRQVPHILSNIAMPVVGGDRRSLSIAAASIIAKVARDEIMVDLAQQHPAYGWETNMGYGTKSHISALQNLGPTPQHRRSFKPVYNIL
jgi:ribonuclease HII